MSNLAASVDSRDNSNILASIPAKESSSWNGHTWAKVGLGVLCLAGIAGVIWGGVDYATNDNATLLFSAIGMGSSGVGAIISGLCLRALKSDKFNNNNRILEVLAKTIRTKQDFQEQLGTLNEYAHSLDQKADVWKDFQFKFEFLSEELNKIKINLTLCFQLFNEMRLMLKLKTTSSEWAKKEKLKLLYVNSFNAEEPEQLALETKLEVMYERSEQEQQNRFKIALDKYQNKDPSLFDGLKNEDIQLLTTANSLALS